MAWGIRHVFDRQDGVLFIDQIGAFGGRLLKRWLRETAQAKYWQNIRLRLWLPDSIFEPESDLPMRPRYDIVQCRAIMLLAVFMVGGLLGPVLHRVHHGFAWDHLRGDTPCDHSQHEARLEVSVPPLHEDLCLQCKRHIDYLSIAKVSIGTVDHVAAFVADDGSHLSSIQDALFLIRGPPRMA